MIRYRFFTIATVAAVVALSFVIGCPSVPVVDDGTTSVEPPPGQGVIDDMIDTVPPPVPPDEIPDFGGIPDAEAINPEPPTLRQLFPGQVYRVGKFPNSVTSGDLDGDGDLDLAVANSGSGNVSILFGNGVGAFSTPVNYAVGNQPAGLKMGDLDGDGDLDLVVTATVLGDSVFFADRVVSILRNKGDGVFAAAVHLMVERATPFVSSIVLDDLDSDGDLDLAVSANKIQGELFTRVSIFLNNGDGTFSDGAGAFMGLVADGLAPVFSLTTGDVDGDGDLDLVVSTGRIFVLFNNGRAQFSDPASVGEAMGDPHVETDDLDGDGDLDLVVGFRTEQSDLDGDGDLDLAVLGPSAVIFLNNGDGTFAAAMVFTTLQISADDPFIQDGVSTLFNNGDGTFAAGAKYQTGQSSSSVTTGDWNGDGDLDLAVANGLTHDVSVLLNNGGGTFLADMIGVEGSVVSVGDLDADGDLDLTVSTTGSLNGLVVSDAISTVLNNGDGTFTTTATPTNIPVSSGERAFVSGDLDGDGDLDLVVSRTVLDNSAQSIFTAFMGVVSILRNNGDGSFAAPVDFETDGLPLSVAIGDLDGDGDQDLAVGEDNRPGGGVAAILLNNGEGIFSAPVRYSVEDGPLSIDTGDLDGDADLDLVVANSDDSAGSVSILLNNGDATFAAAVNYGTRRFGFATSVVIGDFDGDGYQDLAVGDGDRSGGFVSILRSHGDGTFAAAVDFGTGVGGQGFLTTGDLDGDGNLDLAVSNSGGLTSVVSFSVLLGNGDGTFAEAMNFVPGGLAGLAGIGDFDGDGDLDLVVDGIVVTRGFNGDGAFAVGASILFNRLIP